MPPRKRLTTAGADPPPQKPRRTEPAAPVRLWTVSSTVHDVLYAQQVNGLTLQSTVKDLFDALNDELSITFKPVLDQYGHAAIGDMSSIIPHYEMTRLQNELEGFSAYDKLRDFAIGAALLRTYGVDTLSQWSAWRGFREDITLFTRDALDTAAREAGLTPTYLPRGIDTCNVKLGHGIHLIREENGKAIVQIKVAMPLVESVYLHICSHIRGELYFKGCPFRIAEGSDAPKPDLMLTTVDDDGNQPYHLVCCHVEVSEPISGCVLEQAMSCGAFLTPNTCYSAIVIAVVGTCVNMGLMTMLQPPQSPTDATDDEVDFQGIQAPLPPLPESLFQNTGMSRWRFILKGLTWGVSFDYIEVARNNPVILQRYLSILCKPIIYGMQRMSNSDSVSLDEKKQDCRILRCTNVHPELLLNGSSANIIVKRMTVREADEVIEIHRKVGNPIRGSYVCDLSRKIQDAPAQEQYTEFIEATSSCSEEEIQIDKYGGYKQFCCVYDFIDGVTCAHHQLGHCGQAVLLCMVAAVHDDLYFAHCNIRKPNILLCPTLSDSQCTLRLIDWGYSVHQWHNQTQKMLIYEGTTVVQYYNRYIGCRSLKKLTQSRWNYLGYRFDEKKLSYYRFLDIFCATYPIHTEMQQAGFKKLISLNKDKPSRDAVRWLVAKYASRPRFKPVAEFIEEHRLVDMTYAQLAAFPFSYR